jgi:hypothetical protein
MDLPGRESEAPNLYFVTSCFRGAPWAIASSRHLNEGGECRGCERSPESAWSKMELLRREREKWIAKPHPSLSSRARGSKVCQSIGHGCFMRRVSPDLELHRLIIVLGGCVCEMQLCCTVRSSSVGTGDTVVTCMHVACISEVRVGNPGTF